MTRTEFDVWTRHYFTAFPGTWAWLRSNSPDPAATLDVWFSVLGRYELSLIMRATDRLIDGRAEPPKAFERDLTAHHVKAVAGRILDEEARRAENEQLLARPDQPAPRAGWSCLGLYQTLAGLWEKAAKRFSDLVDQRNWVYQEMEGRWPAAPASNECGKVEGNGRQPK